MGAFCMNAIELELDRGRDWVNQMKTADEQTKKKCEIALRREHAMLGGTVEGELIDSWIQINFSVCLASSQSSRGFISRNKDVEKRTTHSSVQMSLSCNSRTQTMIRINFIVDDSSQFTLTHYFLLFSFF